MPCASAHLTTTRTRVPWAGDALHHVQGRHRGAPGDQGPLFGQSHRHGAAARAGRGAGLRAVRFWRRPARRGKGNHKVAFLIPRRSGARTPKMAFVYAQGLEWAITATCAQGEGDCR